MLYLEGENDEIIRYKTKEEYNYIDLLGCDNPFCSCLNYQIVFLSEKEYYDESSDGIPLLVDCDSGKLMTVDFPLPENKLNESITILEKIYDEFTVEDWELLNYMNKKQKEIGINEFDINDSPYSYEFSEAHFANESLMISYQSIFPLCQIFKVAKEGIEYEILDQYCKSLKCDCTNVSLELFQDGQLIRGFIYDYKDNSLEDEENRWIIQQLKRNYSRFKNLILMRSLKVKTLYGKNLLEVYQDNPNNFEVEKITKIGRNEPCPCGSGKKYKKCCLN